MNAESWSDQENDAIVAVYFQMLKDDLAGRAYNKAMNNRNLQQSLGRSKSSIEFKNCNISAALVGFGLPYINGYQPRFKLQMSLAEAVSRWLAKNPSFEASSATEVTQGFAGAPSLFFGVPPTIKNAPPPAELSQLEAIARRFDVAGRDERNRSLGKAGEERVFHHERAHLQASGRRDLAAKVRWVSQEDGDGAGYDIASFAPNGSPRLIEVKTTNGWERTPFYISRNELDVADARRHEWSLVRLFDFSREVRAFELRPPLEAHVSLIATQFQAAFN
ncbi:DUF3883 domain-containing protein [Sinorhizobium mexicanum]|uniref:DUF3883 domain-containing protein n=1 Tax=Sinorhizobium mexicanum TaxID=375549 RepID=A0A859QXM3_9HYPH|nr:DUF3883 domain-containing protein [Sinorhizobium mexicanum]MBP1884976.1 hypothetical protein [Sinorhizobium mexicanum]QLL64259.1 DUF3883 domain-containing protein [Sinorhizobium mexicanum]